MNECFVMKANGTPSYFLYFNPNDSGNDIWKTLKANGELHQFTSSNVSSEFKLPLK